MKHILDKKMVVWWTFPQYLPCPYYIHTKIFVWPAITSWWRGPGAKGVIYVLKGKDQWTHDLAWSKSQAWRLGLPCPPPAMEVICVVWCFVGSRMLAVLPSVIGTSCWNHPDGPTSTHTVDSGAKLIHSGQTHFLYLHCWDSFSFAAI